MIFDSITNCEKYEKINEGLKKAFEFLKREDLKDLSIGRYEIDGNKVFAMVQEYEPKKAEEKKYEAHKEYIDIQYIVKGEENIGFVPTSRNLTITSEYNEEKDVMRLDGERAFYKISEGEFFVFFPEEPHMPGVMIDKPCNIKKVVVKIHK